MAILTGATPVSAVLIHLAERAAQPENTIPDAMWSAVMTLGTIDYGDVVPVRAVGKTIAITHRPKVLDFPARGQEPTPRNDGSAVRETKDYRL